MNMKGNVIKCVMFFYEMFIALQKFPESAHGCWTKPLQTQIQN